MKLHPRRVNRTAVLRHCGASFVIAVASATILATGCGGGGPRGGSMGPTFSGNTTVALLASSTANGQLTGFAAEITSLTLTDETGKQVVLISSPVDEEFIHLNGAVEPLATLSIPQEIYVSATATADIMDPLCSGQVPGELYSAQMANTEGVTVNLPAPIPVTGNVMGLVLDLDVSESTPFSGACPTSLATVPQVASVFNLLPMTIAAEPTNSMNGKAFGLRGIVSSVATGGSTVTVNSLSSDSSFHSPSWTATVGSATALQGGLTASELVAGAAVDMDVTIQQDGSLLATRVARIDAALPDLTVAAGPLLGVSAAEPAVFFDATAQEGFLSPYLGGAQNYTVAKTTYQVSSQLDNVATLPFAASFSSTNLVAGQRVLVGSQATGIGLGSNYVPLTRVTLLPQTIDGTVSIISTEGSFTTYTVRLATYDLFPIFAKQPGQTTLLKAPDTVVVYADSNAQMLNSGAIGVGSVARFYGLVFNDGGTLRMDCAQVSDGVAD
ncbi:MAG: hypothetical protein WCF17_18345 [Terracidiphilus sp.]